MAASGATADSFVRAPLTAAVVRLLGPKLRSDAATGSIRAPLGLPALKGTSATKIWQRSLLYGVGCGIANHSPLPLSITANQPRPQRPYPALRSPSCAFKAGVLAGREPGKSTERLTTTIGDRDERPIDALGLKGREASDSRIRPVANCRGSGDSAAAERAEVFDDGELELGADLPDASASSWLLFRHLQSMTLAQSAPTASRVRSNTQSITASNSGSARAPLSTG